MSKRHLNKNVSRRDVLRTVLAGAGIAALGPMTGKFLHSAEGAPILGHRRILSIFCYGGYDGLNLLVPISNQAYYDRRAASGGNDAISIPSGSGPTDAVDIGEDTAGYRLHPAMANIAAMYNLGEVAAFRMVGYPNANLSHFISQDVHSWGVRSGFEPLTVPVSGWIARYADNYATTPMGVASLGLGRPLEFEGGSTNPFLAASLASFNFEGGGLSTGEREHRLEAIRNIITSYSGDTLSTDANTALDQGHQLADQIQAAVLAYNDSATGSTYRSAYATNSPGRYVRDAAILIRGGFETEIFMTGFGGWDTHGDQGAGTGRQAGLLTRMDDAIGVFKQDCVEMGVWDDMLILISSEFGRRNFMNGSGGTDHGHGNFFFAIGGGVTGGLYGPDVTESDIADNNWLGYGLDYRDIFKEAVSGHMGEGSALVFPETQVINTSLGYV